MMFRPLNVNSSHHYFIYTNVFILVALYWRMRTILTTWRCILDNRETVIIHSWNTRILSFDLYWPLLETILSDWSTELVHPSIPIHLWPVTVETMEVNKVKQHINRTVWRGECCIIHLWPDSLALACFRAELPCSIGT